MEIQRTYSLMFVLTLRERNSLHLWSEEMVCLKRSLLTDWLPSSLNTLPTGKFSQYSQDLSFCIRVNNSDTELVTVFGVFLLEGFSSSVLETETSQCLAATCNSHLRDAIEIPPHFCVGIYETLNILYPELYTCYTSVYSFNSPTENGNYTLLKDIQDNQWKLQQFPKPHNTAWQRSLEKQKHFTLFWCCNLAAWWVVFTVCEQLPFKFQKYSMKCFQ